MLYLTGDTHGDFRRFSKKNSFRKDNIFNAEDYIIVLGDFGLLWADDKEFRYHLKWLSQLPFKILFVGGNHENYNMIYEYPISWWNGGKVRHIIKDRIIYLERGQVYEIEGKRIFAFSGASSHDIAGGILDREDPEFKIKKKQANRDYLPYRILNESWWQQELPSQEEMEEGRNNLEKMNYQVDYVLTHCISSSLQDKVDTRKGADCLTDYFEDIEERLSYQRWYCGHYHMNRNVDEKHTILYKEIIPIGEISSQKEWY